MKLTIIGTGYVGLVSGLCFSAVGHDVVCLDRDKSKIKKLSKGKLTIHEDKLQDLLLKNLQEKSIRFTTSYKVAVEHSNIIFLAVDTPPMQNGMANLSSIKKACVSICEFAKNDLIIVQKSTVPVGTSTKLKSFFTKKLLKLGVKTKIVSNPEFLKEGCAVDDFMKPDRIIIGTDDENIRNIFSQIYSPFNRRTNKIQFMDIKSAELTKYAANAMLATKISFINEIANIADIFGADIELVRKGIGADKRIGYDFLYPGCGYGGSCFPKDLNSLISVSKANSYTAGVIKAVDDLNNEQKLVPFNKLNKYYKGRLKNKVIAIWGLAFKPNTDDTRYAPSIDIINKLLSKGCKVQAYDPIASISKKLPIKFKSAYTELNSSQSSLQNADALIICTEWKEFWSINPKVFIDNMKKAAIFDGRNLYQPSKMAQNKIDYFGIGIGEPTS